MLDGNYGGGNYLYHGGVINGKSDSSESCSTEVLVQFIPCSTLLIISFVSAGSSP
jgi:hypothetical protein